MAPCAGCCCCAWDRSDLVLTLETYGHGLIMCDHHVQGLCRLGYVHRLYIHIHIIYFIIYIIYCIHIQSYSYYIIYSIVFIYVSNAPFQGEQNIKPSWLFTFPVTSALMRCRTASILVPWPKLRFFGYLTIGNSHVICTLSKFHWNTDASIRACH